MDWTCCAMQVIAHLEPLQQRYSGIMADEGYLDSILAQGAGRLSTLFPVHGQLSYSHLSEAPLETWRPSIRIGSKFCEPFLIYDGVQRKLRRLLGGPWTMSDRYNSLGCSNLPLIDMLQNMHILSCAQNHRLCWMHVQAMGFVPRRKY